MTTAKIIFASLIQFVGSVGLAANRVDVFIVTWAIAIAILYSVIKPYDNNNNKQTNIHS